MNLKLLNDTKEDIGQLKKIFFKEVAKYFCGEPEEMNFEPKKTKSLYHKYEVIQYNINEKLSKSQETSKNKIFWLLILYLIEEIAETPCLIILDQYNPYYYNRECQNLIHLLLLIINKYTLTKLLLSSSIDNYDIKDFFLKNINNIDIPEFDEEEEKEEDELEESESNISQDEKEERKEDDLINEEKETFSEYEYYEDLIKQKKDIIKANKNLFTPSKYINFSKQHNSQQNYFININREKLNNEYYNSLVDCEVLLNINDNKEEKNNPFLTQLRDMISNFNYSIKTYYEFFDFKEKYNNNSDDIYNIIEEFISIYLTILK